ncbi:MAG: sigma-70 family RNA polymerase sigma factor [Acidimicrobiia bacterium]|nr:sigma-70 family RNA polymerase sigma factor [Acidimicrobiia bacterium]NNF65209.1 sigma-70 family RNA polymerase sigma factor [Acidimicrobiia bacterium]
MNNATDAFLVSRLEDGDEPAMAELFRRHGQVVESFSRRILHNRTLAEEVTQDVFLRLWSQPTRYDTSRGSLRSYLLTQSHGRSIDLLRSENARRMREQKEGARSAPAEQLVEDQVVQLDVSDRVRQALSRLDVRERRVLELAYLGGLSYRETAKQLGLPEGTVKSQIRAGMRRMRDLLAESMNEPTSGSDGLE